MREKVLIWGAGDAGSMIMKELLNHRESIDVLGFIDDAVEKQSKEIFKKKVLGTKLDVPRLIKQLSIDSIYIAMPSVDDEIQNEAIKICQREGVIVKTLPSIYELIDGWVHANQLKEIKPNDLLGRKPVKLDIKPVKDYIENKCVMVTGAGGSIGSEICRQIVKFSPRKILLLGKGENSIYEIHKELCRYNYQGEIQPLIADVRDNSRLDMIFNTYQPEIIFHAAAHKHVPLMEEQPIEAIRNNIFGTINVAGMARKYKAERFVMISTDKAVNPTSVMGCTKRVAEMIVQSMSEQTTNTHYAVVRFGNVLGSRGSVVPLFKKQIEMGGPVTVTDPEITRYFMTIPEASQLVLQAGALANGGEVFVLNMGKPIKILDLACEMIKLAGYRPYVDIDIKFTGLRQGEKMYEELVYEEDGMIRTNNEKILVSSTHKVNRSMLDKLIIDLQRVESDNQAIEILKKIVPSYKPNH
ncbi:polysaccharide biosynthesis protein [Selenomonas montiformis]|uniref:polysaccharide biosynthesis protein n=1 Tax=Selenomonas montiformis TaxID=2652285 RepID=UPI003F891A19